VLVQGHSEFNTTHSITVSKDRRVFVVDRGHHRMQVILRVHGSDPQSIMKVSFASTWRPAFRLPVVMKYVPSGSHLMSVGLAGRCPDSAAGLQRTEGKSQPGNRDEGSAGRNVYSHSESPVTDG
jgi:hypothetical protein